MITHIRTRFATGALALAMIGTLGASAVAQGYGPPQGPPPPGYGPRGGWDAPPQAFREVQRQGFHDGIEGARRDFDNHRRPDPNNRDEFRHPHVPPSVRADYREGFRRGYDVAMSHMLHEGPGPR
ncbi:hypothetical protein SAMN05421770_107225 [Granulicella rosea]|uniref:Uncharacterized protein n=1 Tax=Granulicella rosea TaxID=474952 RepID=A0A239LTJ9_9BACT|nr:hypothetical protein [Granulicella rosea]SNT32954.1 hypothetical protein SAMN05421770_107225 [Granulicella rosea]